MPFTTAQTVTINEENNGDEFWTANGNSDAAWAPFFDMLDHADVTLTAREATNALAYCETVPGWTGGPAHAPHPVIFAAA